MGLIYIPAAIMLLSAVVWFRASSPEIKREAGRLALALGGWLVMMGVQLYGLGADAVTHPSVLFLAAAYAIFVGVFYLFASEAAEPSADEDWWL